MFEYKVIAAPVRTVKVKGLKTTGDRFARLLDERLNAEAGDGWEFLRAETLPCEERRGLTGWRKSFQTVLVFRRALATLGADDAREMSFASGLVEEPAEGQAAWADHHDAGGNSRGDEMVAYDEASGDGMQDTDPDARSGHESDPDSERLAGGPAEAARARAGRLMAFGRPEPVLRPAPGVPSESGSRPEPTLRSRRPVNDTDGQ